MYQEWTGQTVNRIFDYTCRVHGGRPAIVTDDVRVTYVELEAEVLQLMQGLRGLEISRGTPVAVVADQSPDFAALFLALWRLGAVVVPLNLAWTGQEFVQSMALTDAEVVVVLDSFRQRDYALELAAALPELTGSTRANIAVSALPRLRAVVTLSRDGQTFPFAHDLAQIKESGAGFDRIELLELSDAVDSDDPCFYLPTSGSTGFPKPVVHSHSSFLSNCSNYADALEFTADDRMLNYGPTYHISGMLLTMVAFIRGGTARLLAWFDPGEALRIIEVEKISVTWGFDVHYQMLRNHPDFTPSRIASLSRTLIGSDPKSYDHIRAMGITHLGNIYGCSEYLADLFPYRDRFDEVRMRNSHGRPVEGVVQKIADPVTGDRLAVGELGEICIKGPGLFKGYYNMAAETAAAFDADGFFHTGDYGYVDDRNYVYYRGRLKDTVKSGGENVSAREVEMFLEREIPGVAIAQVIGIPDPRWGEAVTALIELEPGVELTEDEVRARCRTRLAGYKIPKRVFFVRPDDWIVTPTGKFDKRALRDRTAGRLAAE